jgi:hypothetical protein
MPRAIIPNATTPRSAQVRLADAHASEEKPEQLAAYPEDGAEGPAANRPVGDEEDGQRERDHGATRRRPGGGARASAGE